MEDNKDKWVYDRTNSNGEKKFKRYTDENLNDAVEFLEKEVSDFSEDAFEDNFKHLRLEDKKDLLYEIHKLRLEKKNEFAKIN